MSRDFGRDASKEERPAGLRDGPSEPRYGSDVVADTLRALDIPFIVLTPGSSYRGLHDSIVNYLGNQRPGIILCIHEEHAVAVAHGYAKIAGKPLAAALHANVGLFHATMAIFNAWCDRTPVLLLGATGPVDAAKRRPWIDWIHTARDQGAIVRPYTKWDDQPASAAAARESILRAYWIAQTGPQGPVYVNFDAGMQERELTEPLAPIDYARYVPPVLAAPPAELVSRATGMLNNAKRPLIMLGRVSRSVAAWDARVALAEAIEARVVTDLKVSATFPTDHRLHVGVPATFAVPEVLQAISEADVILSLDWVDLAGTLKSAFGIAAPAARVIQVSLDYQIHNGWSMDHQGLPPVDLFIAADPDIAVRALLAAISPAGKTAAASHRGSRAEETAAITSGRIGLEQMGRAVRDAVGTRRASLLQVPLGWNAAVWSFHHPLDFVGGEAGGGVGRGPGFAVGAALALKSSGRLPIAIIGDGDFLMGVTALWTAVHYGIPLLLVVANNRSFFNDEMHQERIARSRGRPAENRWIGQRIDDPEVDLAQMARAQGAVGFGPVKDAGDLAATIHQAIQAVERGAVAMVDVWIEPGYAIPMSSAAPVRNG